MQILAANCTGLKVLSDLTVYWLDNDFMALLFFQLTYMFLEKQLKLVNSPILVSAVTELRFVRGGLKHIRIQRKFVPMKDDTSIEYLSLLSDDRLAI